MNELRKCRALLLAQQQHIANADTSCIIKMEEHADSIDLTIKANVPGVPDVPGDPDVPGIIVVHMTKDWELKILCGTNDMIRDRAYIEDPRTMTIKKYIDHHFPNRCTDQCIYFYHLRSPLTPEFTMIACDWDYHYDRSWTATLNFNNVLVDLPFITCLNIITKVALKFNLRINNQY